MTITLTAACDTSGAPQIPSDQPGTRRFEHPLSLRPQFTDLRFYLFPGGCVTYRFHFARGASSLLAIPVDSAVAFMPRTTLVDYIKHRGPGAMRTGCTLPPMSQELAPSGRQQPLTAAPVILASR